MNHLFSMAMFLLMFVPQNQKLPEEFSQIPEPIRDQATVIVSGTYGQGRTPCILRSDGTRVWGLDSWFKIKRVYRGKVGSRFVSINASMLPKSKYVSEQLRQEHEYLVLLRPGSEKVKKIRTRDGVSFWNALRDEEIIAILELK